LPEGFSSALRPGHEPPAPGYDDARELYEPVYRWVGPDDAAIYIFHGNYWRLFPLEPLGKTQALGNEAGTTRITNSGRLLIDFLIGAVNRPGIRGGSQPVMEDEGYECCCEGEGRPASVLA
jgi:hypothetical protein